MVGAGVLVGKVVFVLPVEVLGWGGFGRSSSNRNGFNYHRDIYNASLLIPSVCYRCPTLPEEGVLQFISVLGVMLAKFHIYFPEDRYLKQTRQTEEYIDLLSQIQPLLYAQIQ
jgi:hypothetical protein